LHHNILKRESESAHAHVSFHVCMWVSRPSPKEYLRSDTCERERNIERERERGVRVCSRERWIERGRESE